MSLQESSNLINSLDPERIYVENVRAAMNTSSLKARTFCEMAVAEGLFERKIGVICPSDGRILQSFDSETDFPKTITCIVCQAEEREHEYKTSILQRIVYYKLVP